MPEPSALDAIRERLKKCTRDDRHQHGMLVYGRIYIEDVTTLLAAMETTRREALEEVKRYIALRELDTSAGRRINFYIDTLLAEEPS